MAKVLAAAPCSGPREASTTVEILLLWILPVGGYRLAMIDHNTAAAGTGVLSAASDVSRTCRSSWALTATTIVDRLMSTAPMAGDRVMPAQARAPAASGIDTMLYPAAQARFWIILR